MRLRVHRHTIPAFISMTKLGNAYLPALTQESVTEHSQSESDEGQSDARNPRKKGQSRRRQDLRGFVRELRRELAAWHLRTDAVDFLRERLGLETEGGSSLSGVERLSPGSKACLVSVSCTAIEARYVRLEWEDGRVGRFKLSNTGVIERAVVIGDQGRDKQAEHAMTGGGGRIETLLERLKEQAL